MLALVTVGSTRFDPLVQAALSTPVLSSLRHKGYTRLVVQCGNSDFDLETAIEVDKKLTLEKNDVAIEIWKFKSSLELEYERADLIISHGGSGTIIDVLRLGKSLIIVPNPTLLDNHQEELASALVDRGHLKASTVSDLPQTIENFEPLITIPFPPFDGSRFRELLDEEMGFC